MKSTEKVAQLRRQVEAGNLDTAALRAIWADVFSVAMNEIGNVDEVLGHPAVYCDSCGDPCFAAKTHLAYGGARVICEETCLAKYAYCEPCLSYILMDDVANPTHTHEREERPGVPLYLPDRQEVAAFNADVMEKGAKFHKTPIELKTLANRKLRSTDPERVFRNFGVELEVEKMYGGPPDIVERTRKLFGTFALIKRDGSLSRQGYGGFEIVSAPATLAFHKSGIWRSFFENLGSFFQQAPSTTGLHIHIGRNTLPLLAVDKMVLFVNNPDNKEFIFGIANRNLLRPNKENGKLYAGVKVWSASEMFKLKQHGGTCPWHPMQRGQKNHYQYVDGKIQVDAYGNPIIANTQGAPVTVRPSCKCIEGYYNMEHYAAVNLRTHRPTVELRIFRGVVSEPFLYACLEFVDTLADFCIETKFSKLNFKDYLGFLQHKTSRYPNLYRLLVNQCWIDPPKDKNKPEKTWDFDPYGIYA